MDIEMEFEALSNLTNIQSFFYGQSVFLTGVTGLVGKVVLEKILRSCPGIGMVYILMRPKRGLTPQERVEKIFNLELFRDVKKVFPNFRKHVRVVEGNITEDRLGLPEEDLEKIRANVSIVIHSAASVKYNDPIKTSMEHNVIPGLRILDLCREMPQIKAIVHLSTSYVKREEDGMVLEKLPKCKVDPEKVLEALEWMDEKCQTAVEEFLLDNDMGQFLTYFLTKAMGEILIGRKRGDLPLAVVRPCYISPTWKAPFPGWIDTIQGISGLFLAGAKGALRALQTVDGLKINIIPVDVVANTILTSAWHVGTTRPNEIFIVHCAQDYNALPPAEEKLLMCILEKREKYPLVNMFRYPDFSIYRNEFAYYVHALIDQWIPALIIDFLLLLFTGKTVLIKVYSKISYLYGIFFRIAKEKWINKIDNYLALQNKLSGEDKEIFFMNLENFDWEEYIDNCLKGGRVFLAHEDTSNIPYAKKKAKIWWAVTTVLKWCLILYLIYYLLYRLIFRSLFNSLEENFYSIHS